MAKKEMRRPRAQRYVPVLEIAIDPTTAGATEVALESMDPAGEHESDVAVEGHCP